MNEWDSSKCACVHSDPYECARQRDKVDIDDIPHRRACECVCHDRDCDEDYDWV